MAPLSYTFHIPTAVNALSFKYESITKVPVERFLDFIKPNVGIFIHLLALLGAFTYPNDRFPYPFMYFN